MMQLLINGRPAVLTGAQSFKLNICNSYFDDEKGEFTMDVPLPLQGVPENQMIFRAPLQRPEVSLKGIEAKKYPMTMAAPHIHLSGFARVLSINEKEAKVQLVGGRSAIANGLTERGDYIDEMELGNAWDGFPEFSAYVDYEDIQTFHPGKDLQEMKRIFHDVQQGIEDKTIVRKMAWGYYGMTDCVCCNTVPKNDADVNPWRYERLQIEGVKVEYRLRLFVQTDTTGIHWERTLLAPQPYLFDILPRIIRALGYEVGDLSYYEKSWMKNIVIANNVPDIRRAKCLPHWTAGQLFKELSQFLGAVWVIQGKTVSLIPAGHYYAGKQSIELKQVLDEHTSDIDGDADYSGTANTNIDYLWPDDISDKLKLPDEVFDLADEIDFATMNEMEQYFNRLTKEKKAQSHELYRVATGHHFASLMTSDGNFNLVKVNQAGAMINRDDRDIDEEMRIVPAMINEEGKLETTRYYKPVVYSINDAINKNETTDEPAIEERDVMEVAYNGGDRFIDGYDDNGAALYIPIAVGFPWRISESSGMPEIPKPLSCSEYPADGHFSLRERTTETIGIELANNTKSVNSCVETCFDFLDEIELDPTKPYLIHGKRYACRRLEVTFDERGLKPLKRGYFFEIG